MELATSLDGHARLRLSKPIELGSESLGSMDNKALNRSVLCVRVGQVVRWSYLPLHPTTIFTNSNLFDASVNAGVIQITVTSKSQTSTASRYSLKALLCLILVSACYLGGRESQQSTIREQQERIDRLEAKVAASDEERISRAQQLANLFAQNRQLANSLAANKEESDIQVPANRTDNTTQQ